MSPLDCIVPPRSAGGNLVDRPLVAAAGRLARLRLARALAAAEPVRELRPGMRSVRRLWTGLARGAGRRAADDLVRSDPFLGWLAGFEDLLRLIALSRPAARRGSPASASWSRLMDACTEAGLLAAAAPEGGLPPDFPRRVRELAVREAIESLREFVPIILPYLPKAARRGRVIFTLRAEPWLGRPRGEIEFPAGSVRWIVPAGRWARDGYLPGRLRASTVIAGRAGPACPNQEASLAWPEAGPAPARPAIGAPVRPSLRSIRVERRDEGFGDRVAGGLDLLESIWPDAAALVRSVTSRVVPLAEPGTVSFSSARVPGVSFINIRSAPRIRLAEDLLHEAVHERLHRIERVRALVRPGAPRFYSPWRREWRPLRGLLHGACTFVAGARFFERALAASNGPSPAIVLPRARRLWLERRLIEETDALAGVLVLLEAARRKGWLRPAGARLARTVRSELREAMPAARACERALAHTRAGRSHLLSVREQRRRTRDRQVRWSRDAVGGESEASEASE